MLLWWSNRCLLENIGGHPRQTPAPLLRAVACYSTKACGSSGIVIANSKRIAPISTETVEIEWQLRTLGPSVNIRAEMIALVPLVRTGTLSIPAPFWLSQWSAGVLSLVFCVRAVGDFRFVGFFKRVRGTPFAIWDTRLFSPLYLLLAAGFARVATL